jgi:hypothetical protein
MFDLWFFDFVVKYELYQHDSIHNKIASSRDAVKKAFSIFAENKTAQYNFTVRCKYDNRFDLANVVHSLGADVGLLNGREALDGEIGYHLYEWGASVKKSKIVDYEKEFEALSLQIAAEEDRQWNSSGEDVKVYFVVKTPTILKRQDIINALPSASSLVMENKRFIKPVKPHSVFD